MKKKFLNFLVEHDAIVDYIQSFVRDREDDDTIINYNLALTNFLDTNEPEDYITDAFAWQYNVREWYELTNLWSEALKNKL